MIAYWIEAVTAVKENRVIAYSVWHFSEAGAREKVSEFSVYRKGGMKVALRLAEIQRDDHNGMVI